MEDPSVILKPMLPGLEAGAGVAAAVMGAGFGVPRKWRAGVMPVALATGFLVGYGMLFPDSFPQWGKGGVWFEGEAWKMVPVAAILAGLVLGLGRMLPRRWVWPSWVLLAGCVGLIVVRPTWSGWEWDEGLLAGGILLSAGAMRGIEREEKMAVAGPVVMWMALSAASFLVMGHVDLGLGKVLILLAVLAGVAGVVGILPAGWGWRGGAGAAGLFLAVMLLSILALADFYRADEVTVGPLVLLGAAPLGVGVVWLPVFRGRAWLGVLAAVGVSGLILAPGVWLAVRDWPALE